MTWLSPETLDALDTEVIASVYAGQGEADTWHQEIAMDVPSTSRSTTHSMSVDPTMPREWERGTPRVIHYVQKGRHEVVNVDYEKTVGIHRFDLEDDIHAGTVTRQLIQDGFAAGGKFATHKDVLTAEVLIENPTCVDGSPLFGTHHVNPFDSASSTYENEYGNMPLTPDNVARAMGLIGKVKGPDGTPLHLRVTAALVPSMLEQRSLHIFGSSQINGTDNPLAKKGVRTIVGNELMSQDGYTDGDEVWHLIAMSAATMGRAPIIFQRRQALRVVSRFALTDPHVFDLNEYLWGADERCAIAPGYPYTIFRFRPGAIPS